VRALMAGVASLAGLAGVVGLVTMPSAHRSSGQPTTSPACVGPSLNESQALAGARVTVSPGPDTRDASPATQISLLGVPAAQLTGISVAGSHSGAHAGRLAPYSQGDGASFVPAKRFAAGETVTVRGRLREGAAASAFAWSFAIGVPDTDGDAGGSSRPRPVSRYYQHFHSRPELQPPTVTVTAHSPAASAGDLLIAPYSGPGQYGPMILDEDGSLLWFKALAHGTRASDFRVQRYEGKPVLTWWQDPLVAGGSSDSGGAIADDAYRIVRVVRAGNGYQPDLHEFQLTPRDTAYVTVYDALDCDLRAVGGPTDAAVADTLLQEIDVRTGLVRYEWHSLDHVALADAHTSAAQSSRKTPFDYFHINSVDVQHDGSLLVDSRNTWAAYDVDARTGQVRWRLGGRHSSFKLGAGAAIAYQHDAREQPDGAITFFDNGATPAVHPQSRAIQLRLDTHAMTATLVRVARHDKPLVAGSQGNLQALDDGDWLVGWGEAPYLSEYAPDGAVLFDAHLPAPYESYRAYRLAWSGHPTTAPAVAVVPASARHGATVVYASWNGATEVASWRVLAGSSSANLAPVAARARNGFETAIALSGVAAARPYVAVQALNSSGVVVGVSHTVKAAAAVKTAG
jgi:hypothetical protein